MRLSFPIVVALVVSTVATMAGCSGGASDSPATAGADFTGGKGAASADEKQPGRFTQLKKGPTDPDLAAFSEAAGKFDSSFLGTYRFNKAGPEKTDPVAREKRIKEVMHRFMCSFFDDSIDITHATGASALGTVLTDVDIDQNSEGGDTKKLSTTLTAVLKNKQLDVESGSASGNNTGGEVMGVYDIAHNEVLFFGFTNCGSDD